MPSSTTAQSAIAVNPCDTKRSPITVISSGRRKVAFRANRANHSCEGTDVPGRREYNLRLSQRRAKPIQAALVGSRRRWR